MCGSEPVTTSDKALSAPDAGLCWLATADMVALTAGEQADCLRALERAESRLTVAGVLAQGDISVSWARQRCDWSDALPEHHRADADQIMLAAAAGGCDLADIGRLAEEMYRRCAPPDTGPEDDNFTARNVRLTRHFRGHGKLDGDLTPECTAALQAVLDALGKRAGPEDLRSPGQIRHDARAEMCRRFVAAGGLPDRPGQATQIQLRLPLCRRPCLITEPPPRCVTVVRRGMRSCQSGGMMPCVTGGD